MRIRACVIWYSVKTHPLWVCVVMLGLLILFIIYYNLLLLIIFCAGMQFNYYLVLRGLPRFDAGFF